MRLRFYRSFVLLALAPVVLGADDFACVAQPAADSIVITSPVPISGLYFDGDVNRVDGMVQLNVNGVNLPPVNTTNGEWAIPPSL